MMRGKITRLFKSWIQQIRVSQCIVIHDVSANIRIMVYKMQDTVYTAQVYHQSVPGY